MLDPIIQAANEAIAAMKGPTKTAKTLTQLSGRRCTRDQVQKWKIKGVASGWTLWVEVASGISRHRLRPDYYPVGSISNVEAPVETESNP